MSLYAVPEATEKSIRNFRLKSSRVDHLQAQLYNIAISEQNTILPDETDIITSWEDLLDELPDNWPRFIIASVPVTTKDGRKSVPLILIYWLPPTADQRTKMLYAGAVELVRSKAGVSKLIEAHDEDDFEDIESQLV